MILTFWVHFGFCFFVLSLDLRLDCLFRLFIYLFLTFKGKPVLLYTSFLGQLLLCPTDFDMCVSTFICLKIYFDFLFDFFVDISCLIASCVGSTFFMFLKFSSCILIVLCSLVHLNY